MSRQEEAGAAAGRATDWLRSLPPRRLEAISGDLATTLERGGLTIYDTDLDRFRPIPAVISPQPVGVGVVGELSRAAHDLLSAAVKAERWLLDAPPSSRAGLRARRIHEAFTPFEMSCVRGDPARLQRVAVARVDFFLTPEGRPRALEINATIPAMQGYSDILVGSWTRAMARERGLDDADAAGLSRTLGSNTEDLLDSLLGHYALETGSRRTRNGGPPSILIVSRRGDAQTGELRHYERVFGRRGHRALHVCADEVEIDPGGRASARGESFDLIYRHVFASRIESDSPLAQLLRDPGPTQVLNPVLGPLEAKGLLAVLTEIVDARRPRTEVDLDEGEEAAVRHFLAWTRLLVPGPATVPDGSRVDDLVAWVSAHPEALVLKPSWDYGGRGVMLGPERGSAAFRARARRVFGAPCIDWKELVARAERDPAAWVVQEYVEPPLERHLIVEPDASGTSRAAWRDVFVDLSLYTNLGLHTAPGGAACRASVSPVVNLREGGALAPLIPEAALQALFPSEPGRVPQTGERRL